MSNKNQPTLVIVSDWIRRDLHQPLRHFKEFKIVHLYRQAGYQDMKPEDFENPRAIQWHGMSDLWQKIVAAKPDILQGGEPWANRSSLLITFVTWWYKKTHPSVTLIWPSMENRPLTEKFSVLERSLLSWWGGIYGRSSDLVMYLNKGARQNLINAGIPESKLKHVIWATWGIDCGEFSPRPKSKVKSQKSKVILFVGKISEAKGVPWLLEAFEEVHRKFPTTRLVLAGPLDQNSNIKIPISKETQNSKFKTQRFISDLSLDIGDSLEFGDLELVFRDSKRSMFYLGIIKNKDIPDLFRQADVVVAPSITTKIWEEQVGMVNLQAMACGVPVISTKSGAIPEFVEDGQGAVLVPEKDSQAIAEELTDFLTHEKKRIEFGKKARQYVLDHFEVRVNIQQVEKLLKSLL